MTGRPARLLGPSDPLPRRPARVVIAGASGAGKSTLAGRIGAVLDLPVIELDALFHGPGWEPRPTFTAEVAAFAATERWVTEWQYDPVRPLLAARAELMVWLDLPRVRVLRHVSSRTVRRRARRTVLWHGNVEPPLRTILSDPDHVIRWAWRSHGSVAPRVHDAAVANPGLLVVRLRSQAAARRWVDGPLRTVAG